jgi:hypothetical protein
MAKKVISIIVSLVLLVSLGACAIDGGSVSAAPGTLKVFVTDAPPDEEVTAVLVTVSSIEVHRAVAEQERENEDDTSDNVTSTDDAVTDNTTAGNPATDNTTATSDNQTPEQADQDGSGWTTLEIGEGAATFDLLQVQGINQFFADGLIAAGKYTQVRLIVDKVEVSLGGKDPVPARIPSGALKLVSPFDVVAGETISLVLDFDAEKSVTVTGNGEIIFKPVIKISTEKGDLEEKGAGRGSAPDDKGNAPEDKGKASADGAKGRENAADRGRGNSRTGQL